MKSFFTCKFTAWIPLLAGMAGLLSACGQYGNLYPPEDRPADQTQQSASEPQDKDKTPDQEQETDRPQD